MGTFVLLDPDPDPATQIDADPDPQGRSGPGYESTFCNHARSLKLKNTKEGTKTVLKVRDQNQCESVG